MTKEEKKAYDKAYRERNREYFNAYHVEYRKTTKSKEYRQAYTELNKDKIKQQTKLYHQVNKDSILAYQKTYFKDRLKTDQGFRYILSLRNRQKQVLKGRTSTTKGLGCNQSELKAYIQSKFQEGMSFDNYGNKPGHWSIDHIVPISSYEKDINGEWDINSEYNKQLIHYTNLQPMWHLDNLKKGKHI